MTKFMTTPRATLVLASTQLETSWVGMMASIERMRVTERPRVCIAPPALLDRYGPSALMRYFITAGDWSYEAFADEVSQRHKTKTMSTDTVVGWTNHNVLPKPYRAALLRVIDDCVETSHVTAWREAFFTVWSEHSAAPQKKRAANANASVSILSGRGAR